MAIDQRTLTTGEVEGSGIFDELMRTVKAHAQGELTAGRLTEQSYAQVYLGGLQNVLQVATQYALRYEIANKELLIADEQLKQNQKQNELLDLQKEQLRIANDTAQYNYDFILPKQLAQLDLQNTQLTKSNDLITKQLLQADAQLSITGKQEDLVDEQIIAATGQHTDLTTGLIGAQLRKANNEADIMAQKLLTEKAQTEGSFWTETNTTGTGGLIGAELRLKDTQKDSFLRDAEQKAAKMYTDVFATLYATDPDDPYVYPENYGFDINTARKAMDKLLEGVNVERSKDNTISDGVAVPTVDGVSIKYPRNDIDTSE